ncbi:hypothetical protein [Thermocoleostomius sinensis]|uniref:Uncharacterized protein n=1 Tax=Thermocoleostomius sinensis A174 TaxID=2016057 RepID=A0A9E9C9Y3_9CYAN|nr:hypothetical protein [Thermocoleostomius sinensis]WAL60212.1 hypothetical protein OXH18_24100 [Thermocoleostomius sinensis A174]
MATFELFQHPWLWSSDLGGCDLMQQGLLWHGTIVHSVFAQFDTDVFKPVRGFFNYFIQSGQIWALLIGTAVGYLFRSLTSYG